MRTHKDIRSRLSSLNHARKNRGCCMVNISLPSGLETIMERELKFKIGDLPPSVIREINSCMELSPEIHDDLSAAFHGLTGKEIDE